MRKLPHEIKTRDKFNQIKFQKESLKDDSIRFKFTKSFKNDFHKLDFHYRKENNKQLKGEMLGNAVTLQTKQRFLISTNKANEILFDIFFHFSFRQTEEHEFFCF